VSLGIRGDKYFKKELKFLFNSFLATNQAAPASSERSSPVKMEEEKSSHHKSKHRSRDKRSRSRDRSSRSRRSRSRSRSKKKKRNRSPTPPSAYNVSRR
jgi:hypothetical protein